MPYTEPSLTRGALIADLACVTAEISDLQVRQAQLAERTAGLQSRIARMVRDLSTSTTGRPLAGETFPDERPAPAAQAAHPQGTPSAQDAARPVEVGKALDAAPVGMGKVTEPGQSRVCVTSAGAGGESADSADTAPAADAKLPKRVFPQSLPGTRPTQAIHEQPPYKPSGPKAAVKSASRAGEALDLFGRTLLSTVEIANRLGMNISSAGSYISVGRGDKDPRVLKGDAARHEFRVDQTLRLYSATDDLTANQIDRRIGAASGTAIAIIQRALKDRDPRALRGEERRKPPEPVQDTSIPVNAMAPEVSPAAESSCPPAKPTPLAERPVPNGAAMTIPDGNLIAVRGSEVHGPAGIWRTSVETAKAFGRIADGQLYSIEVMAKAGGLDPKVCDGLVGLWKVGLAKAGIDLFHMKGAGLRLRLFGASS